MEQGIKAQLVDARFAKPLDESLLCDLGRNYDHLLIMEENCLAGCFGSAVLELLADRDIKTNIIRVGIPDEFIEQGRVDILCDYLGLDAASIVETILMKWPQISKSKTWELRKIVKS
jgi:1-deoxy-D-xylulose-5-phosphate synthase